MTWRRRGEALLALVLLPARVGGVARAARLVGARERDYRRWLAAARAWLASWAFDVLRDELRSAVALPSVPRDDAVRARLLVLLERVLRPGGAS